MNKSRMINAAALEATKQLTEQGKLIEAGFAGFAHMVIPKDAPAVQLAEMQLAFMAGAEHVFTSIMNMMEPGDEPTADDYRRIDLIQAEIDLWRVKLFERLTPSQGRA